MVNRFSIRKTSFSAIVLLAAVSCMKDETADPIANQNVLSFSIEMPMSAGDSASGHGTKSAGGLTLLSEEGDSLILDLTVCDNVAGSASASSAMEQTKGMRMTASALNNFKIGVNSFLSNTSGKYLDTQIARNGHWAPVDENTYYWPKATGLDFWAWAPYEKISAASGNSTADKVSISSFSFDHDDHILSFSYDLGEGTAAVDMPDLMFANVNGLTSDNVKHINGSGCVPLPFRHALAAVSFRIEADYPGTVTRIEIGGAAKSGHCSFIEDGEAFYWTVLGYLASDKTFIQDFDAAGGSVPVPGTPTAPYSYENAGGTDTNAAVFMMIPQDITADGQYVSITFNYTGKGSKTYTGYLDTPSISEWEAGKAYVYNVTIPDVRVSVDDEVNETEKTNPVITNTGNTPAFIRAAIVANWVNAAGRIAYPWNETDGSFTGLCPAGWSKSGQYYYYADPVAAGAATPGLFEKYTAVTKRGLHLEMDIIVQAISAKGYGKGEYQAAWTSAAGIDF